MKTKPKKEKTKINPIQNFEGKEIELTKFNLLSNKDKLVQELFLSLISEDAERENYIFQYFSHLVFNSSVKLTQTQITHIQKRLKSGDERYSKALFWDMEFLAKESPWFEFFEEEYAICKELLEERKSLSF